MDLLITKRNDVVGEINRLYVKIGSSIDKLACLFKEMEYLSEDVSLLLEEMNLVLDRMNISLDELNHSCLEFGFIENELNLQFEKLTE